MGGGGGGGGVAVAAVTTTTLRRVDNLHDEYDNDHASPKPALTISGSSLKSGDKVLTLLHCANARCVGTLELTKIIKGNSNSSARCYAAAGGLSTILD